MFLACYSLKCVQEMRVNVMLKGAGEFLTSIYPMYCLFVRLASGLIQVFVMETPKLLCCTCYVTSDTDQY